MASRGIRKSSGEETKWTKRAEYQKLVRRLVKSKSPHLSLGVSDVFGPFLRFPEDAMISRHFQNEAKLTLLQWGVFLDIKNIPAPADSGEER